MCGKCHKSRKKKSEKIENTETVNLKMLSKTRRLGELEIILIRVVLLRDDGKVARQHSTHRMLDNTAACAPAEDGQVALKDLRSTPDRCRTNDTSPPGSRYLPKDDPRLRGEACGALTLPRPDFLRPECFESLSSVAADSSIV